MNKKDRIIEIVNELCGRYMTNTLLSLGNYGICSGEVGIAYLCSIMYDLIDDAKYKEWSKKVIGHLLIKNTHLKDPSLGYGTAAVYWLFASLEKKGLITGANEFLNECANNLITECEKMIFRNDLDYFRGALGILFALNENNMLSEELFFLFNSAICDRYSEKNPHRLDYEICPDDSVRMSGFNLGTPHGLTGIVLFLLQLKEKKQFHVDDSIRMILDLFIYIKQNRMNGALFPMFLRNSINDNIQSHLAWCYGNLTIIYAFKKAGILLDDPLYSQYADEILADTVDQTGCRYDNLSLCHGINSVSLLFTKLYDLFGTDKLREKANNWYTNAEMVLYQAYENYLNKDVNKDIFENASLINGFPGTALYFLSRKKLIDTDWRFLLL